MKIYGCLSVFMSERLIPESYMYLLKYRLRSAKNVYEKLKKKPREIRIVSMRSFPRLMRKIDVNMKRG